MVLNFVQLNLRHELAATYAFATQIDCEADLLFCTPGKEGIPGGVWKLISRNRALSASFCKTNTSAVLLPVTGCIELTTRDALAQGVESQEMTTRGKTCFDVL